MSKKIKLLTAAKSLFNTLVTPPTGIVTDSYTTQTFRGRNQSGMWFFGNNGVDHYFDYTQQNDALIAYTKCPPLAAIINRKAQAYINGITKITNTQGKDATSLQAKSLRKLFTRPNPLQSWKQFEAQGYIYELLFGYNIVLPLKPVGFPDNIDATQMWNIPPFMIDIEETKTLFYQADSNKSIIKKIVLTYKEQRTEIPVDEVFIMKDFSPSFDSIIIPESRVCSLSMPINNIIAAYESRNVLMNYRGALGMLSLDPGSNNQFSPIGLEKEDKEQLQQDFKRYGLKKGQWQVIITSAALKWNQMGFPTKDLMLFEEIEDDIMRICDALNYPYQLISSANGTTFANVNDAKKLLYHDGIIPEAESNYEQWAQFFNTEEFNLKLAKTYNHIPALQDDSETEARARYYRNQGLLIEYQNDCITLNRWRELNDEDTTPDGDVFFSQSTQAQRQQQAQQQQQQNQNNNNANANQNTDSNS
jgi:hypothetical protein